MTFFRDYTLFLIPTTSDNNGFHPGVTIPRTPLINQFWTKKSSVRDKGVGRKISGGGGAKKKREKKTTIKPLAGGEGQQKKTEKQQKKTKK